MMGSVLLHFNSHRAQIVHKYHNHGTLIELISYFARAFSLGVRLFANIVAGHTLLKILSGFLYPALTSGVLLFFVTLIPMAIFIALVGLEIAVSLIQAYVFTILTCSYLKDAIELH